jgi:uncharacterized protein (TIGR02266 family)
MSGGQKNWDVPVESRRIAHPQKIYLKFSKSDTYVEEYLIDLSMTGMFIRCLDPPPAGTRFDFKMSLISGEPALTGIGEVVWIRKQQARLSHPRGMGVRFVELPAPAREQIRRTVERYTMAPDTSEGLETLRSVVEETLGEVLEGKPAPVPSPPAVAPPGAPPPGAADRSPRAEVQAQTLPASSKPLPAPPKALPSSPKAKSRSLLPVLAFIVLLLGAAVLLAWRFGILSPSPAPGTQTAASSAGSGQVEPAPRVEPVPATPPTAGPGTSPEVSNQEVEEIPAAQVLESSPEEIIRGSLDNWAISWASKETEAYLAFYASAFRPPSGLSREEWQEQRRDRISRPRTIGLEIENVRLEKLAEDRYRVLFQQTYRSDSFEDTVWKTMTWIREGGEWKILEEGVAP